MRFQKYSYRWIYIYVGKKSYNYNLFASSINSHDDLCCKLMNEQGSYVVSLYFQGSHLTGISHYIDRVIEKIRRNLKIEIVICDEACADLRNLTGSNNKPRYTYEMV